MDKKVTVLKCQAIKNSVRNSYFIWQSTLWIPLTFSSATYVSPKGLSFPETFGSDPSKKWILKDIPNYFYCVQKDCYVYLPNVMIQ